MASLPSISITTSNSFSSTTSSSSSFSSRSMQSSPRLPGQETSQHPTENPFRLSSASDTLCWSNIPIQFHPPDDQSIDGPLPSPNEIEAVMSRKRSKRYARKSKELMESLVSSVKAHTTAAATRVVAGTSADARRQRPHSSQGVRSSTSPASQHPFSRSSSALDTGNDWETALVNNSIFFNDSARLGDSSFYQNGHSRSTRISLEEEDLQSLPPPPCYVESQWHNARQRQMMFG